MPESAEGQPGAPHRLCPRCDGLKVRREGWIDLRPAPPIGHCPVGPQTLHESASPSAKKEQNNGHFLERLCASPNVNRMLSSFPEKLYKAFPPQIAQTLPQIPAPTERLCDYPGDGQLVERVRFCAQELLMSRQRHHELKKKIAELDSITRTTGPGAGQTGPCIQDQKLVLKIYSSP